MSPREPERSEPGGRTERPREPRPSPLDVRGGVPRPRPIWSPVPLSEIAIAVGIAIFALGFFGESLALLVAGLGVLTVAVVELSLREHFAGFRSHSLLLALLPVTALHVVVVLLVAERWRGPLPLALDLALAGALAWWLRGRFRVARERALGEAAPGPSAP